MAGCSGKEQFLVGQWNIESWVKPSSFVLKSDKTFTSRIIHGDTYDIYVYDGTWSVSDETVELQIKSTTLTSPRMGGAATKSDSPGKIKLRIVNEKDPRLEIVESDVRTVFPRIILVKSK